MPLTYGCNVVGYWGGPIPLVRPNGASLRRSLTTVATIIATPNANATRLMTNPGVFPDLRDAAAPAPPRNRGSQPAVLTSPKVGSVRALEYL